MRDLAVTTMKSVTRLLNNYMCIPTSVRYITVPLVQSVDCATQAALAVPGAFVINTSRVA